MIGLLDSTNSDVSPEGALPQGHLANVAPALPLLARSELGALAGR